MYKPDRIAAICDAVVAIAITLLVLGLEVPSAHEVPEQKLTVFLYETIRPLQGYVNSFLLIGTYWMQHYAMFHYVERANRFFVALNGMFLLFVSFVPFPTGLHAAYPHDEIAMLCYACSQAACGFSLWAIWSYATTDHRLIGKYVSVEVIKSMKRRILLTPLYSLLAFAVSFISLDLSRVVFLAIPLTYLSHRVVDQGWTEADRPTQTTSP